MPSLGVPRRGAHARVAERPDTVPPTCLAHRFRELLLLPAAGVSGEAGVFTVEQPFGVFYYATYEASGRLSCDEATQKVFDSPQGIDDQNARGSFPHEVYCSARCDEKQINLSRRHTSVCGVCSAGMECPRNHTVSWSVLGTCAAEIYLEIFASSAGLSQTYAFCGDVQN